MLRQAVITKDGSHTISIPEMNVTYHSIYGAIQESQHVFIAAGLKGMLKASGRSQHPDFPNLNRPEALSILEMGFGTGLNALLTLIETESINRPIHYTTIELFPLSVKEASALNYCKELGRFDLQHLFQQFHQCEWEKDIPITPLFTLHKTNQNLVNFSSNHVFDLVYFDAFGPASQPALWTKQVFDNLYAMMSNGGMLVTYCSKGDVRRAMLAAGFQTQKIPGPPRKKEMLRAVKLS